MGYTDGDEKWKPVLGYEEHYHVSDRGQVMRVSRTNATKPGRILKPKTSSKKGNEYLFANLSVKGTAKTVRIHRMVCEAFFGPIQVGMQINHKNGIKTDNRLSNLEVVTPSENILHSFRVLGRKRQAPHHLRGEQSGRAKLTNSQADEIRELCRMRLMTHKQIAKKYNVSTSTVGGIVYNITYRGAYVEEPKD